MKYLLALGIFALTNVATAQSVQLQTTAFTFVSPATEHSADAPEQLAGELAGVAVIDLNPAALSAVAYSPSCTDWSCAYAPYKPADDAGFTNTYSLTVSQGYRITGYTIVGTLSSVTSADVFGSNPPRATANAVLASTVKSADGLLTYATGSSNVAHSLDGGQISPLSTTEAFFATGQLTIALDLQLQTAVQSDFYFDKYRVCYDEDEWSCHWDIRYEQGNSYAAISLSEVRLFVYSEQISAVPEPDMIYLLLAGLVVTGIAVRSGGFQRFSQQHQHT